MPAKRHIELLSPARDLATGRVAVDAGADAVYIGGPGFGARHAAANSVDDVAALVAYAHPFGVRVYAALNTLLFESELVQAHSVARDLIAAGVDALIIQDMAFLRMNLGDVEFHASTQVSSIAPEDINFLAAAGFRRVILERALSLDEIRSIRSSTPPSLELECFVHGAICVGFSGRCFFSRALDPSRSGNRGDCSQPCRLPWDLVDGAGASIIKGKHLISPRDLDLSARLGSLLDVGVTSFKIEGRLKDSAYVRNIVSHYNALINSELASRPHLVRASVGHSSPDFTPNPAKSFSRGSTTWFLDGPSRGVAFFDSPKSLGECLGTVATVGCQRTGSHYFTLGNSSVTLSSGDGICFLSPDGHLHGTSINRIEGANIYPAKHRSLSPGVVLFRNHDHAFVRALDSSRMRRRIAVTAAVEITDSTISIAFTDTTALSVTVSASGPFDPARDPAKMAATVRSEIAKSGATPFDVQSVALSATPFFIPVSTLAALRRDGLDRLWEMRKNLLPRRFPASENIAFPAPRTPVENVTNSLAEKFWRDHGVLSFDPPTEISGPRSGTVLMRTRYCLRREVGRCLRKNGIPGPLFLTRGTARFALDFDCKNCEMTIIKP